MRRDKKPNIRYLKEMEKVLHHQELAHKFPGRELYYVWRGVDKFGDLRYDITLIPSQMLGAEFVRTKGNRNSERYSELYTILEGEAVFLMQRTKDEKDIRIIQDIVAIKAKKNEWIFIPPEYAVIIINPSKKTLKTGNWVSEKNKNIYEELEKMGGMGYFAISQNPKPEARNPKIKWIKNKNYQFVPKLRFEKPLKEKPKNLDYLRS